MREITFDGHLLATLFSLLCCLNIGCENEPKTIVVVESATLNSASVSGPIAEFQELDIELGEVEITSISTKATATIKVRNAGDEPLLISRMEVSCGCTRVAPPNGPIEPGKSVDIDVGVTISRSGKEAASPQRTVTVHQNQLALAG